MVQFFTHIVQYINSCFMTNCKTKSGKDARQILHSFVVKISVMVRKNMMMVVQQPGKKMQLQISN